MSKHTPGPWRYQEGSDPYTHIVRAGEAGLGRFVVQCGQSLYGIEEANARLIAAAPEMLEALKAMVDEQIEYARINNLGDATKNHNVMRAMAAIAKAEGRS